MVVLNTGNAIVNGCRALWLMTLLLAGAGSAAAQGDRLSFYGFFDLELEATNRRGGAAWSFDQHHFNVASIYRLDGHWRVFGEIEWEHGPRVESGDVAGEVALERATLEYKRTDAFQVKIGKFLPPFGLYNLRHDATPTFLSTSLPSSIYGEHTNPLGQGQRLFSKFGTGVQVSGNVFTRRWEAEYFVYVINGRGPEPAGQDNNQNKGVGGRLAIRVPGNAVQVGASYYTDRNGEAADTRQRSVAVDVTAHYAELLMEAELLVPRLERVDATGQPNGSFRTGRGYYVQVSRTLVGRLTPFVRYDFYDPDTSTPRDGERDVVLGLNLAATGAVFFKSEVHLRTFQSLVQEGYQLFLGSVAVAF